jgi:hypothetical protein
MTGALLDGRALAVVQPPGGVGFEIPLGEDFEDQRHEPPPG